MHNKLLVPALPFVLLAWHSSAIAQEATAQSSASALPIANQYICMFDRSVGKADVRSEANRATGSELGRILHIYENTIRGFAVRLPASAPGTDGAVARLKQHNPRISQCVTDGITRAAVQRRPTLDQTTPWGVARVGGAGDGSALAHKAWVIDSGVDLNHPDLNVDTANDYDFIDGDDVADDGYGHGTHVAGIIGALNNSIGVVGVAAGVMVVPVRVLNNQGVGPDSGVIAGIDYAAGLATAGDVINLSLVADAVDPLMDEAVRRAAALGIFVTIAAGNDGANAGNYSPGRTEGTGIFTVSAFGSRDTWARFSNFGNPPIDYSEPGVDIRSTYRLDSYATLSGTSMAAPHLAGILLLNSAGPAIGGTVKRDPDGSPDKIGVR
jgi:hypothetical protein